MRIPDIELRRGTQPELREMLDWVRLIINNGKYISTVVTTIPTEAGEEGEIKIYDSGTTRRLYQYYNGAWKYIAFT